MLTPQSIKTRLGPKSTDDLIAERIPSSWPSDTAYSTRAREVSAYWLVSDCRQDSSGIPSCDPDPLTNILH